MQHVLELQKCKNSQESVVGQLVEAESFVAHQLQLRGCSSLVAMRLCMQCSSLIRNGAACQADTQHHCYFESLGYKQPAGLRLKFVCCSGNLCQPICDMASEGGPWALDAASREETISRLTANIASLAFAKGVSVALEDARSAAVAAEKRAYTVAGVESRTTTGHRPQSESLRAYTR